MANETFNESYRQFTDDKIHIITTQPSEDGLSTSLDNKIKEAGRYVVAETNENGNPETYISDTDLKNYKAEGTIFYSPDGSVSYGVLSKNGAKLETTKMSITDLTSIDADKYLKNWEWEGDGSKITKSNVGLQDRITMEDANSFGELTWSQALNTLNDSLLSNPIYNVTSKLIGDTTELFGIEDKVNKTKNKAPNEKSNNLKNISLTPIETIRENINTRKNIKLAAKQGPYNSLTNLVGLAGVVCAGSLGKGDGFSWRSDGGIGSNILGSLFGTTLKHDESFWANAMHVLDSVMGVRSGSSSNAWVLDAEEISSLNAADFHNIMGNKPGLKTGLNAGLKRFSDVQSRLDFLKNIIKDRNSFVRGIGRLYVEPYYNENGFVNFSIPFEFNPNITEGSYEAKYNETQLMNKILPIRSYISTSGGTLQIETTYMALAPDITTDDAMSRISPTDLWMLDWTNEQIEKVELQLRSLVMPNVVSESFVRPPIVQVRMESSEAEMSKIFTISDEEKGEDRYGDNLSAEAEGDLYKYPKDPKNRSNVYLQVTNSLDSQTRYKRYIVTNVSISPLESYGVSYTIPSMNGSVKYENSKGFTKAWEDVSNPGGRTTGQIGPTYSYRRNGFKVSLTLSETTKNFIDLVPDFKAYYDAWNSNQKTINGRIVDDTSFKYTDDVTQDSLESTMNKYIDKFWDENYNFSSYIQKNSSEYIRNETYQKMTEFLKDNGKVNNILKKDYIETLFKRFGTEIGEGTIDQYYDLSKKILDDDNYSNCMLTSSISIYLSETSETKNSYKTLLKNLMIDENIIDSSKEKYYSEWFESNSENIINFLVLKAFKAQADNKKLDGLFNSYNSGIKIKYSCTDKTIYEASMLSQVVKYYGKEITNSDKATHKKMYSSINEFITNEKIDKKITNAISKLEKILSKAKSNLSNDLKSYNKKLVNVCKSYNNIYTLWKNNQHFFKFEVFHCINELGNPITIEQGCLAWIKEDPNLSKDPYTGVDPRKQRVENYWQYTINRLNDTKGENYNNGYYNIAMVLLLGNMPLFSGKDASKKAMEKWTLSDANGDLDTDKMNKINDALNKKERSYGV